MSLIYNDEQNRLTITKTTDFIGNFVYENYLPAYIVCDEGRVVFNSKDRSYFAEAYLKDHLGNVRVAFRRENGVLKTRQVNSYYPFGMNIKGLSQNGIDLTRPNKYLYNGKMMQDEMSLNWLDYGARFYDAVIGWWHSVDPLAEKYPEYSPYCYTLNNPIKFTDPNGAEVDGYKDLQGNYNWFDDQHNDLIYKNDKFWTKITDNKDVFEMAKAGILDNMPAQRDPGSVEKPDVLTNFEMWLDAPSSAVREAATKIGANILYGMANSPYSLLTGKTLGGTELNSKEKTDAFVDTAPGLLSLVLTGTKSVIKVTEKDLDGFNKLVKAAPELTTTKGLPSGMKWQTHAGQVFQWNKVSSQGLNSFNQGLKTTSVIKELEKERKK